MMKNDYLDRLLIDINSELVKLNRHLDLYVTGGSAMYFFAKDHDIHDARLTRDIDYVNIIYNDHLRDLLDEFDTEFAGGFVDAVPVEDYLEESELYSFSETLSHLNVYVPKLEIIFTNKAISTRQKDLQDCMYLKNHVDIKNCEERLKELLSYQAYINPDSNIFELQNLGIISKLI